MNLLELSQTIRRLRQERHLTVEQLAELSGFSKGFISQVENFRISPSLRALNRIAEALGVALPRLFESRQKDVQFIFGRVDEGMEFQRDDSSRYGMRYLALAGGVPGRKLDPVMVEYHPCDQQRDFRTHETEEFFLLLSGEVRFFLFDDKQEHRMKAGDTLYLKANLPHRVELEPGCPGAKAVIVYSELEA